MKFRGNPREFRDAASPPVEGRGSGRRPGRVPGSGLFGLLRRLVVPALLIGGLMAGWTLLGAYQQGEGLVTSNAPEVSSTLRARVERFHVNCGDRVSAGTAVVTLANETVIETFRSNRARAEAEAREIEGRATAAAAQAAESHALAARARAVGAADRAELASLQRLLRTGDVSRDAVERTRGRLAASAEEARAHDAAADAKLVLAQENRALAEQMRRTLAGAPTEGEAVGRYVLRAPAPGVLVACRVREGDVVDGDQPVFRVFDQQTAFLTVYWPASKMRRIRPDDIHEVSITGDDTVVRARVALVYPVIGPLPEQLQRFFWQRPQWTQYGQARLTFVDPPAGFIQRLSFGAAVRTSRWDQTW